MNTTQDHSFIQQWVERRSGHAVQLLDKSQVAISFPGYVTDEGAQPIQWETFFEIFDANGYTFAYEETRADGSMSHVYAIN
jgi:hypothetical protein